MRIAVFHDLPAGGGKRALYEHCRELARLGHELDLFIPETANEFFLPLDPFIQSKQVFRLIGARRQQGQPSGRTRFTRLFVSHCQKQIAQQINKGQYDVVFVQLSAYPAVPFVLRYLKVPSLFYLHEPTRIFYEAPIQELKQFNRYGDDRFQFREWFLESPFNRQFWIPLIHRKRAEYKNVHYAPGIIANSYFSRDCILRAYGVSAVKHYCGVDTELFRPLDLPKESVVLSVGKAQPYKGFRFLVTSIGRIAASIRPRLVIIAHEERSGEQSLLRKLASDLRVDLTLLAVNDEELVQWYNRAMVVAFVPYVEPFGFIPLEAMACGVPVVGICEGGVRETVVDGETGYLIDRDPDACADAISRLLKDPDLRHRMGAAGRRIVETRWTWRQSGELLAKRLRQLADGQRMT